MFWKNFSEEAAEQTITPDSFIGGKYPNLFINQKAAGASGFFTIRNFLNKDKGISAVFTRSLRKSGRKSACQIWFFSAWPNCRTVENIFEKRSDLLIFIFFYDISAPGRKIRLTETVLSDSLMGVSRDCHSPKNYYQPTAQLLSARNPPEEGIFIHISAQNFWKVLQRKIGKSHQRFADFWWSIGESNSGHHD